MSRRVQVLLASVALLAATRGVVALVDEGPAVAPALVELDPAQIARVVLTRGARRLVLERESGPASVSATGWIVRGPDGARAAARVGLDDLLLRVLAWRRDRPAGDDPSKHAAWAVTDDAARCLRLEDAAGQPLADLRVGRIAGVEVADVIGRGGNVDTSRLGLLVRRSDEALTWVVTDFFTRELEPEPRAWLASPLVSALEDVQRVAVDVPEGRVAMTFDAARQRAPAMEGDPRPVDGMRAHGLLTTVVGLRAVGLGAVGERPPETGAFSLEVVRVAAVEGEAAEGGTRTERVTAKVWLAPARTADGGPGVGPPRALLDAGRGVIEIEAAALERLRAQVREGFVRQRVFFGDLDDLAGLEWTRAGRSVIVERAGAGWRVRSRAADGAIDGPRPCDVGDVAPIVDGLMTLRAVAWDESATAALRTVLGAADGQQPPGQAPGNARVERVVLVDHGGSRQELAIADAPREGDGCRPASVSSAPRALWLDVRPLVDILGRLERLAGRP